MVDGVDVEHDVFGGKLLGLIFLQVILTEVLESGRHNISNNFCQEVVDLSFDLFIYFGFKNIFSFFGLVLPLKTEGEVELMLHYLVPCIQELFKFRPILQGVSIILV